MEMENIAIIQGSYKSNQKLNYKSQSAFSATGKKNYLKTGEECKIYGKEHFDGVWLTYFCFLWVVAMSIE